MRRRIAVAGLSLLCVSAASVVAAQSASAVSLKTITCVTVAPRPGQMTLGYAKADCKGSSTDVGANVVSQWAEKYGIRGRRTRYGVPAPSTSKMKSAISGVTVELQSKEATGSGTVLNEEVGGEEFAEGTATLTYKGVTVTAPAGKGCEVSGGEVKTKELKFTTAGQGMFVKFEPASGTTFATVKNHRLFDQLAEQRIQNRRLCEGRAERKR